MRRKKYTFPTVLVLLVLGTVVSMPEQAFSGEPAYMSEPWTRMWGPPGGIGYDVRMCPDAPDIMYVTSSPGGIFKSTDGGQSWFSVTAGIEPSPGFGADIFCATIDPHDCNTVWVGTQYNAHIYRSTDGGETWEQRDNGIIPVSDEHSVRGITVDPFDPSVVYLGLEATYFLTIGDHKTRGQVYKSTDTGLNWTLIWEGDNLARYIWVDPRNTQRIYVSTGIFDRAAFNSTENDFGGVGILRSDDGGQTWDTLNQANHLYGLNTPSLFMHPRDPDVLFAAATNAQCPPGTAGGYVTRDGGTTWDRIFPEPFAEAVEIATSDPDVWYLCDGMWMARSDDAGQDWKLFRMGTATTTAGNPIDLQVDPRDPYRIFVNNYGGGNMLSTDGGETWVDASKGYSGAQVWEVAVDPQDSRTVFGSVSRGGTFHSEDGGETWQSVLPVVACAVVFQERHSGTEILVCRFEKSGHLYRSIDGGATWDSTLVCELGVDQGMIAAQALAIAPSDPQIFYIGFGAGSCAEGEFHACNAFPEPGLFRSSDGGYAWHHVGDTPFKDYAIIDLAVSLDDPSTVFAATGMGPFVTRDGGSTWQFLSSLDELAGGSPPQPGVLAPSTYTMVVDPFDPQVVYAGSPKAAVFRSSDRGETWEQAAAGMNPNAFVTDLVPDPNRSGTIYACGRFSGVFVSTDWAQTWQKINEGLDRPSVQGLALNADGTVLYAGTSGAGVFRLGVPLQNVEVDIRPRSCPNPLNPRSKGVLPVAILGAEDFDVTTIDRGSISLEGVPPLRTSREDVVAPADGQRNCDCTEDGPDGIADLTLKFDKGEIVAALGQTASGDEVVLTLTGELTDGTPIEGMDCVVITPVRGGQQSDMVAASRPKVFALGQNQPNPVTRSTVIRYQLPEPARTRLRVYDVAGRVVRTLKDGDEETGYCTIAWDGRDSEGSNVAGGIYFYVLRAGDFTDMKKMVVVR